MISHHWLPPPVDGGITSIPAAVGVPMTNGAESATKSLKMRSGRMSVRGKAADGPIWTPCCVLTFMGMMSIPEPAGDEVVIVNISLRIVSPGRNPGCEIEAGCAV